MHLPVEHMNEHFAKVHLPDGSVLHIFTGADGPDAQPHDHPWPFKSVILQGGYVEQIWPNGGGEPVTVEREQGDVLHNAAGTVHRITHLTASPTITRVWPGEHERKSGFYSFEADGRVRHRFHDEPEFCRDLQTW